LILPRSEPQSPTAQATAPGGVDFGTFRKSILWKRMNIIHRVMHR
jgi:hypothetical protein